MRTGECKDGGLLLSELYAEIPKHAVLEAIEYERKGWERGITVRFSAGEMDGTSLCEVFLGGMCTVYSFLDPAKKGVQSLGSA